MLNVADASVDWVTRFGCNFLGSASAGRLMRKRTVKAPSASDMSSTAYIAIIYIYATHTIRTQNANGDLQRMA